MKKFTIFISNERRVLIHLETGISSFTALSHSEVQILKLLLNSPNGCSRQQIFSYAWSDRYVTENSLNVAINKIRKTFKHIGINESVITIRGFGYKLNNSIDLQIGDNSDLLSHIAHHNSNNRKSISEHISLKSFIITSVIFTTMITLFFI